MSGKKNTASLERDSVKISALGEELKVDPREIVAAAKEMTIENAKVPASWVTAGQADRLRAKFGGNKDLKAKLERKQRYLETGEIEVEIKPAAPQTQAVKMGKETYERDRRSIFGVVANSEGERVEQFGARGLHAKPAVSGITRPPPKPVEHTSTTTTENAAMSEETATGATPAKRKFIGVQVSPPVRRAGEVDSRFGVVSAAPEPEKPVSSAPAPNMDMWAKLNDGRAPIEMPGVSEVPTSPEKIELEEAIEILHEHKEVEELPPAPVETPKAKAKPAATAPVQVAELEEIPDDEKSEPYAFAPKLDDVPVKWQPKHKAFGAKQKVKHHKAKLIQSETKHADKKPERKEQSREEAKRQPPIQPAKQKKQSERQPAKPEGLLAKLARTFLGRK